MAARGRRKGIFSHPVVPYLAAALLTCFTIGAIAFATWRAWPTIAKHWPAKTDKKGRSPVAPSSAEISRLKKENEKLAQDNQRLRELLRRTSETLARKTAELDELRLQHLIQERISAPSP